MGNKLVRRRQAVDEKYTKPQGLYQHRDVDHKKLRKLILDSKLAPCYPGGDDDSVCDLEECPICFLYYPSLNRSRCCMKGICTECFLQMKTPNSTRPTQCPFCKTLNYAVEYRGVKTNEEKATEQVEEQKVIEAKLRIRRQELQDEEDRMQRQREVISSIGLIGPCEGEYSSIAVPSSLVVGEEIVSSQQPSASPTIRQPLHPRQNRDDEFDLYLEDMMVMEAIWLSIQENGRHQNQLQVDDVARSEHDVTEDGHFSGATTPVATSSFTCGALACATEALAEHQQTGGETSTGYTENMLVYNNNMLPGYGTLTMRADRQLAMTRDYGEWGVVNHGFEVGGANSAFTQGDEIESGFQTVAGPIVPESFEEQMMMTMAVLPAESQARTSAPGVAWH